MVLEGWWRLGLPTCSTFLHKRVNGTWYFTCTKTKGFFTQSSSTIIINHQPSTSYSPTCTNSPLRTSAQAQGLRISASSSRRITTASWGWGQGNVKSTTTSVVVFVVTKLLFLLGKKVGQFSPKLWGTFVGEFQKMFKNFTIFGRESRNFKIVLHYNHYNFPKKIPLKKKSHEIKNSQSLQVMGTPPPQGGYLEIWAGPDMKISLWRPSTWSISSLPFAHF